MKKFNSQDLAEKLSERCFCGISPELYSEAEKALFHLACVCENEKNDSKFRALWCFLEAVGMTKEEAEDEMTVPF